ncbi:MAG: ribosome small subunit-dependent GTPase A [Candidatus Promineifilaceae bacterium]
MSPTYLVRRAGLDVSITGLVVKAQSGFFTVETDDGRRIVCQIPGRLKKERRDTDLVAAGDRVTVSLNPDGTGLIESVAERERVLSRARPAPEKRSILTDQEQVLVANPDQVVLVFSIRQPAPSLRKLDRFLVVAEMNELPAVVCVNKIDLVDLAEAKAQFENYEAIGYSVIYTSAKRGDGIEALRHHLKDKISVLAGSSGVGKTSLLNAIQPGLGRRVKEVSQATEKGLHTTRYVELVPLDIGGYVADTPGIRSLALFDLEPGELDAYFREIAPLVAECQFSDCTHVHEPNCAVRAAVAEGRISAERYDSYLRLREEHDILDEAAY